MKYLWKDKKYLGTLFKDRNTADFTWINRGYLHCVDESTESSNCVGGGERRQIPENNLNTINAKSMANTF